MKNLKLIFLVLGCVAALSLTSCLSSDDDNDNKGLTPTQISQCHAAVRGTYSGMLVYPSRSALYGTDTVDVSWSVGADTMLVLKPFPAKIVAEQIYDNEMRNALMEEDLTSELKCYLGFYNIESEVQFLVAPLKVDYPVFYKNATHTLSVYFWSNNYSYGFKNPITGAMGAQIVMAAAYLDNNQGTNYFSGSSSDLASIPVVFSTISEQ
jgi:hypothetical protein